MANRNNTKGADDYYPGYRHPKQLIGYVVWSYPTESSQVADSFRSINLYCVKRSAIFFLSSADADGSALNIGTGCR